MEGLTTAGASGAGPGAAFRTAGRFLEAAGIRESPGRRRNPFSPLVHLLINIFFCAAAERYLADDPDGVYLPLFITVQCLLGVLITLGFIARYGGEIVKKTRHFPGSAAAAYYFLAAGSLRRPEFYLFTLVGCVFPAVVYAPGKVQAAAIVAISALCVLTAQVLCWAASVRLIRSSLPLTGLAVIATGALAAVVASVFVFRADALAASLPMAGWAASGIAAFASGDTAGGVRYLLYLTAIAAAVVAVFRK